MSNTLAQWLNFQSYASQLIQAHCICITADLQRSQSIHIVSDQPLSFGTLNAVFAACEQN